MHFSRRAPARSARACPPVALLSAEATLQRDLGLKPWEFSPANVEPPAPRVTRVTLDVADLARILTAPSTAAQRLEWARNVVLEAQETLPSAGLKHLYTSIGREGSETWLANHRRRAAWPDPQQSGGASTRWSSSAGQGGTAQPGGAVGGGGRGAGGDGEPAPASVLAERAAFAAELMDFARQVQRAGRRARAERPKPDCAAAAAGDDSVEVDAHAMLLDVLRAARPAGGPPVAAVGEAPREGEVVEGERAGQRSARGASRAAPSRGSTVGAEVPVLLFQPRWRVGGADGERVQALLRFQRGIGHGDRVVVKGPGGEPADQYPLIVPRGMLNLERVLASLPARSSRSRRTRGGGVGEMLRVDIVLLPPEPVESGKILVGGVTLVLPPWSAPGTSLVVALPVPSADPEMQEYAGAGSWLVDTGPPPSARSARAPPPQAAALAGYAPAAAPPLEHSGPSSLEQSGDYADYAFEQSGDFGRSGEFELSMAESSFQ